MRQDLGIQVRSAWELLADESEFDESRRGWTVMVHDPCASRHDETTRMAVRGLVAASGAELLEPESSGLTTRCCGLGGSISDVDPQLSRAMARRRTGELTGSVITYCSRCQVALGHGGSGVIHLAEFLFEMTAGTKPDRAARGSLRRYLNRLLVKRAFRGMAAAGPGGWE